MEIAPCEVDNSDHDKSNKQVTLHSLEGHLLTETFKLAFSLRDLFLMILIAGLGYVLTFELLKLLV